GHRFGHTEREIHSHDLRGGFDLYAWSETLPDHGFIAPEHRREEALRRRSVAGHNNELGGNETRRSYIGHGNQARVATDAQELRGHFFGAGREDGRKRRHHHVEFVVAEWQRFGIALPELDVEFLGPRSLRRLGQQVWSNVNRCHVRAFACGG